MSPFGVLFFMLLFAGFVALMIKSFRYWYGVGKAWDNGIKLINDEAERRRFQNESHMPLQRGDFTGARKLIPRG